MHEAAELYQASGCDGIVGLGGGSSMDCAKGVGIIVRNGGRIGDYRGADLVQRRVPPLVCMPTTCGTGSEVTSVAVITDPDLDFKLVVVSPHIAPDVGLVDPDLVASAPAAVIASTGIDALAHAVESYVNRGSDPVLDALNIAAIRMIGDNLRTAVADREPDAIAQVTLASMMAGIAFNINGNAIVHAASTPVTARHHVPHGVANGIFLPAGLEAIRAGCVAKLGAVAEALGEDVSGLSAEAAADLGRAGRAHALRRHRHSRDIARVGRRPRGGRHPSTRRGRDEEPQHPDEPGPRGPGRAHGALPRRRRRLTGRE